MNYICNFLFLVFKNDKLLNYKCCLTKQSCDFYKIYCRLSRSWKYNLVLGCVVDVGLGHVSLARPRLLILYMMRKLKRIVLSYIGLLKNWSLQSEYIFYLDKQLHAQFWRLLSDWIPLSIFVYSNAKQFVVLKFTSRI